MARFRGQTLIFDMTGNHDDDGLTIRMDPPDRLWESMRDRGCQMSRSDPKKESEPRLQRASVRGPNGIRKGRPSLAEDRPLV